MNIDVLLLPADARAKQFHERIVVVIDVLRATTTIAAALFSGATEVRVFGSLDEARTAHASFAGEKILAGEARCLPPEGFDLGNSPCDFSPDRCRGRTIFLATTNGTRALCAAQAAHAVYASALVNSSITANSLHA